MKKMIATAILFGLGTGLALAEGDAGNQYAYKTMLQVQSGNYVVQVDQNGEERFIRR